VFNLLESHYDYLLAAKDKRKFVKEHILPRLTNHSKEDVLMALDQLIKSKKMKGARNLARHILR